MNSRLQENFIFNNRNKVCRLHYALNYTRVLDSEFTFFRAGFDYLAAAAVVVVVASVVVVVPRPWHAASLGIPFAATPAAIRFNNKSLLISAPCCKIKIQNMKIINSQCLANRQRHRDEMVFGYIFLYRSKTGVDYEWLCTWFFTIQRIMF